MHFLSAARLLSCTLILTGGVLDAASQPAQVVTEKSRPFFYQLAEQVASGDRLQQFDFANIALSELTGAFQRSYRESREELYSQAGDKRKLARWRHGLDDYVARLNEQRQGLNYDSTIEIATPRQGPVSLYLDNTPVVISGPELAKARQLEQRIVDRFCHLHDCTGYREQPPIPKIEMPRVTTGRWQFQHRGGAHYRTPDGLAFIFRSIHERQAKQHLCETIAADLRLLVNRIRNARRAGYRIDWQALTIDTLYDGKTEHVTINRDGDYLSIDFDYFSRDRPPNRQLMAWVQQRAAGQPASVVMGNAEQLLTPRREPQ